MKFIFLSLIFIPIFYINAYAKWEEGFKYEYPRRYKVLDSLCDAVFYYIDSMKARQSYEELRDMARKYHDPKALLIADKLEFYRRATFSKSDEYRSYNVDSIAPLLIARSKKLGFPAIEGSIYYGLGIYYFEKQEKYSLAFENFLTAFDIFQNLSIEQFPEKGFYNFDYAMRCYRFGDYKSAISFADNAGKFPYRNVLTKIYNFNLLGMSYYHLANYDRAREFFLLTYEQTFAFKKHNEVYNDTTFPTIWRGIAMGNIGNTWYAQKQYDKAIPYLQLSVNSTMKYGIWDNTCGFAIKLGNIYLERKQLVDAKKYLDIAKTATYLDGGEECYYELHQSLSQYYKLTYRPDLALMNADSAMWWKDSLERRLNINKKTQAELIFAKQKHSRQETQLKNELSITKIIFYSLLGFMLLGGGIGIYFIGKRQLKMKTNQKNLEQEKRMAENELMRAKEKIDSFSNAIQDKNRQIEDLEKIQEEKSVISKEQTELLETLRKSIILTDENWEDFRQNFEIIYPGYIHNIKTRFPECSPAEYRIIVLEKLHLNNKEMAAMLGVSPETIRSTKSRMKKKLGEDYLQLVQ